VTTIFGNASLLGDRRDLPEQLVGMVGDIATDAERLRSVVENLLTLTRADASVEVDVEPQVLAHIVSRVITSFGRRHRGREVRLQIESRQLIVQADAAHLELVIGNLLGNAHKYSPSSEAIEVSLRQNGEDAEVVVLDRGIGFTADEAEGLFATFHRTDAARKVASGLGIGLSACRTIAEMLRGRIWARPREGGGAEFGFALPIEAQLDD
jgi:K+-sensing histidine kinase KdpD